MRLDPPTLPAPHIHVAAGVVIDASGRVLIAQRPLGKHLAGGWEFPGGKLEPGEGRAQGLARELAEELGIVIRDPRPLLRLRHAYPHGEVLLDVWIVRRYRGVARGLDGQALRWLRRAELERAELLPADRPILAALRLPERLRRLATPHYYLDAQRSVRARRRPGLRGLACASEAEAAAALRAGAQFVVLIGRWPEERLAAVCAAVPVPVYARAASLERAWALGASGLDELHRPRRAHARGGAT